MFKFSFSKLVGSATDRRWSQTHIFQPADKKLGSHGALFLAMTLEVVKEPEEGKLDLASFGKEAIHRFNEEYFGEEVGGSAFDHLKTAVEKVSSEFEGIAVEAVAMAMLPTELSGKVAACFFTAVGSGSVLVFRGSSLYRILGSQEENNGGVVTASGFAHDGDIFFAATKGFYRLIAISELKSALSSGDPSEATSILAPKVHATEENSGVAVVTAKLEGEASLVQKVEEVEEVEEASQESAEKTRKKARSFISDIRGHRLRRFAFWLKRRFEALFSGRKLGRVPEKGEIVVGDEPEKRRRVMLSVALAVFVLLLVSVFFGWRQRERQMQEEAFSQIWDISEHQYQEALDLMELNPLRSRALLAEAKLQLQDAISEAEDKLRQDQIEKLRSRVEEIALLLEQVSGEHRIEDAGVFLDLELVRPGTYGEELSLHEGVLVVLDKSSDVLIRIGVENKTAETVGGGTFLRGSELASAYADRGFVLSDIGVVEVSLSGKTSALVLDYEDEWGEIVDLEVFGGNIYLLDRARSEIHRYPGTETGFGSRQRWFSEDVEADLSGAVKMTIDGDIWVLTQDEILSFRRGVPQPFAVSGLDKEFDQAIAIYTDSESSSIYILDRGNRRVLVLNKSGEYRQQYIWEGMETVSDMVVSEDQGKILLLSGSVIYEIEMNER